jgi:phytanoyl-CoA hydroxylase
MVTSSPEDLRQWKQKFDQDGFIFIPGFLAADELAELKHQLERYIHSRVPELPRTDVYYEDRNDRSTLKQMAHMKQHEPYFAEMIVRPKWLQLAQTLLAGEVVPQELEWFNKPPQLGKLTPPHQDGYYFMLEPNEAITMWLALDPVNESNGCVRYVAGSHRRGLRPHGRTEVLGFSQGITDYGEEDRKEEVPMVAEPGDLLVHHAMTVHRADGNPSQMHRRSLGLIYYAARARQDKDRLAAYQQKLNQELQTAKKI